MEKTIVIFANSVKKEQHCVAGKCTVTKQWIRPVSSSDGKELSDDQVSYVNSYSSNGRTYKAKPLQKIKMRFHSHAPLINQPENYVITSDRWEQNYNIKMNEIGDYLDSPPTLWGDNSDKVPFCIIESGLMVVKQSLFLVCVSNLFLVVNDKQKRRARFIYNNQNYDLSVTDPQFFRIVESKKFPIESAILCVSLGERFEVDNHCYKIVAGIFLEG